MTHLTIQTDDSFSTLLELAANNDLDGFKRSMALDPSAIDEIELWYGRKKLSNKMVLEPRTPLMVASTYGSLDVLKLIVSLPDVDVNRSCGDEKTTALHCAASGGSVRAVDAVKILLLAGANPNSVDANGHRPCDVIFVVPKLETLKFELLSILGFDGSSGSGDLRVTTRTLSSNSSPLSSYLDEDGSPSSDSTSSPMVRKFQELTPLILSEKKEYPIDPSLPDIKNIIYASDEFRMFSFKVRPCSRAYSHDWTECPFVHPGENARRRDPRKFHYSCVPCPEFRKGACRRGDLCEYAHGVFECWLHPAQYRTRLCKDGTSCNRRVCFFAHTNEELRPLFVSTGSALPSPRLTSAAMEMTMNMIPCSPSSVSMMSPSPFTPPMSPSANGMSPSSLGWPQSNVPTLHLAGGSLQSSRLRSSLNAWDISADEFSALQDIKTQQLLGEMSCLPSNSEIASSSRYNPDSSVAFSPTHKSAVFNQFQQQQSLLCPINTNVFNVPEKAQQIPASHSSFLQATFGITSPSRMSPRNIEPSSPMNSRLVALSQHEKLQQLQLRSHSSRELGTRISTIVGSSLDSSKSEWSSLSGKLDWSFNEEHQSQARVRRSNSFELGSNGEEPDLSWVQSLVKDPSPDVKERSNSISNGNSNSQVEDHAVLGAWLEQMHLPAQ